MLINPVKPHANDTENGLEAHVEAVKCILMASRGPKKEIPVKDMTGWAIVAGAQR